MCIRDSLWRVSPDGLEPVHAQKFSVETDLEDMVESAPDILGEKLLVIGETGHDTARPSARPTSTR